MAYTRVVLKHDDGVGRMHGIISHPANVMAALSGNAKLDTGIRDAMESQAVKDPDDVSQQNVSHVSWVLKCDLVVSPGRELLLKCPNTLSLALLLIKVCVCV